MTEEQEDQTYLKRALALAKRGEGKTSPNPMVGSVIIRPLKPREQMRSGHRAEIVGEGYHHGPGQPHAEIVALAKAGRLARGGTLYTNLEPCCHTDKRTPPCVDALIASGITRVVIAMKDPNPKVNGRGIARLEEAGIAVTTGIMEAEARQFNERFVKYMITKRPFVILKAAMTLDGKIATRQGESRWISGPEARTEVHQLRSRVDAVLVGIGTVLADNPLLTARNEGGGKNPLRVVIDPGLKIPLTARLVRSIQEAPTLILTQPRKTGKKIEQLQQGGVWVERLRAKKGHFDWKEILQMLGRMGVTSLLIEGGAEVNGQVLREGVVDKVLFYIAPRLLCGNDAKAVAAGRAMASLADAVRLYDLQVAHVGDDLRIEGYLKRPVVPRQND
jgi:diaminohydroxyphosphoribosylaminopyrimidine deaminase/5-amino-6-(5-phosphoribosylamino)uracil reductase